LKFITHMVSLLLVLHIIPLFDKSSVDDT
jgi:hypothetical protein